MATTNDRPVSERPRPPKEIPPLGEKDAELVNSARRCLMDAMDHSRALRIQLRGEAGSDDAGNMPAIELPPKVLKVMARVLELMGERRPLAIVPSDHALTTQEAANLLNVSRPFVIKQIQEGKLKCHMAGSHRRIAYDDLIRFRSELCQRRASALERLATQAQDLKLGYED